jgi:hypothetical protein
MIRLTLVMLLLLSGCTGIPLASDPGVATRVPDGTLDVAGARTALAQLKVAAPARMDGYSRSCDNGGKCVFGQPWFDADGDGCDQRSQVLARDLTDVVRKEGRCAVKSGTLHDPYTGATITTISKIQIDHVVPLAAMWRGGAASWSPDQRTAAANDLRNLLAVEGKTNQAKGDQTPDEWMPPNTAYVCPYARIYVTVKSVHALTVTSAEQAALERALATCR